MIKLISFIILFLPKNLPHPDSFDFAIAISVQVNMEFHPCKCGNPPFRGGDIGRRATCIKQLKKIYKDKILYFDAGNFVKITPYEPYAPPVFSKIAKEMKIDAMGVGYYENFGGEIYLKKWADKFPFATLIPKISFIPREKIFKIKDFKIIFTSYSPLYEKESKPVNDYFENAIENKNFYVFASCNMAPENFGNLPSNLLYIYASYHKFETVIDTLNYKFIYITPARYGLYFPVLFFKYINGKFKIKYFVEIPMDSNVPSDKNIDNLENEFQKEKRKYEEQREKEIEKRIKR
jgi:hypothetical protein